MYKIIILFCINVRLIHSNLDINIKLKKKIILNGVIEFLIYLKYPYNTNVY